MAHFSLLYLLFSTTILSPVKPRSVYLDKELKEASLVVYAEITNYNDSTIFFTTVDSSKAMSAKAKGIIYGSGMFPAYSTGYWPLLAEKVLIVVGSNGYVSLFAVKEGNDYHFWSPGFTGSTALFTYKTPARKLPDQHCPEISRTDGYESCWEGCLLPVDQLNTYGR